MSSAVKGRRFEHEIRELFRQAGFSVIRGAGSKGEMLSEVDLVCCPGNRRDNLAFSIVGWTPLIAFGAAKIFVGHDTSSDQEDPAE